MIVFIALYLSVASQLALAVDMENCWVSSLKRATLSLPRFRVLSHSNGFFFLVSQVLLAMSHSSRIFQFTLFVNQLIWGITLLFVRFTNM